MQFKENDHLTLGVEIELQLVDPITRDLGPFAPEIISNLSDLAGRVKAEIFQSMVEIDTPVTQNAFEVGRSLRSTLEKVRREAFACGAKVLMAGTHPFAKYKDRLLSKDSRYHKLVDRNQWIARRLQIFGMHVHIGVKNGEHAMAMTNSLCHYLPVILAMSASSPYWQGMDTGLASSRITAFESLPTGGHPYLIKDWQSFQDLTQKLIISKSITSLKDLWWDIRPNPSFGTVEVRIADCPPTIKEVESLVAIIHTLAVAIDQEISQGKFYEPPPEWILRENKWRASRYGVDAELIQDHNGRTISFSETWEELKIATQPVWESLNYGHFFTFADLIVRKGPSYFRQRKLFRDFETSVDQLIAENEADFPLWT